VSNYCTGRLAGKLMISRRHFSKWLSLAPFVSWVPSIIRFSKPTPTFKRRLIQQAEEMMDYAHVPGLCIGYTNGESAVTIPVGVKTAGIVAPIVDDVVFQAGSLGKPVFAYGVLKLRDRGLLDLDRPLNNYLPGYLPNEPLSELVTARMVLSHQTGLQNWRQSIKEPLQFAFTPGSHFSYSGEGYFFLQLVLERITGSTLVEFMRREVLEPLQMHDSSYIWQPRLEDKRSDGHDADGKPGDTWNVKFGKLLWQAAANSNETLETWQLPTIEKQLAAYDKSADPVPNNLLPNCAGSLMTTVPDYMKFMECISRGTGLSATTHKEWMTPQVQVKRSIWWGLGLGFDRTTSQTLFWHWGDNYFFQNFMAGTVDGTTRLVTFTNGTGGKKVYERLVLRFLQRDLPAFLWV
jgi:CubicO group peptidase (beta-lactamase class C family)